MSVLSDDTDVLLLIPPDFFLVPSDSDEDTLTLKKPNERLLVSDLISQVNDLEGRICEIENKTSMSAHGNLQRLRHFGSADALNSTCRSNYNSRSLQTTPLKTQTLPSPHKNWRRSPGKHHKKLEQHHNMLTSHHYVNQKEKDDQILKEINNFFKHKNRNDDDSCKKNMEEDKSVSELTEDDSLHLSTAVFNLNKVNDLLKQLEETQAEIEQKLKLKGLSGLESDENSTIESDKKLRNGCENKDERTPRRFLNFDYMSPRKPNSVGPIPHCADLEFCRTSPKKGEGSVANSEQTSTNDLNNLLSLCNLWGNNKKTDDSNVEDPKVLKQKYLEEKCRRQHCEELIQKLQLRLLEEQQKIAVAIKVDQEKDEAISKLTEGWNKLLNHWRDLEAQRNSLSKKLQAEREKFQTEVSAACQTVKRYEVELSKALDLAHGYKEKCEVSERERKTLLMNAEKESDSLRAELKDITERLHKDQVQMENLEKLVAAKEESLIQAKNKIIEMQNQIREIRKSLKDQQTEIDVLKHEKEKLGEKLKDEKNRISALEQNKKHLLQLNEELKKKEKSLKDNVKALTEQIEKIKIDLKEFYQEQVEKIVQEKLKEFQEQLSTAEKSLQKEIEERERKVTEMAVKQVQQIVEKHVVEVNLMEEKHSEELELWKIKVLQAEEKVQELQKKLEMYSSQKTEIAQKLQNVMETQWQEALKIITATSPQHQKSPRNSGRPDKSRQNTFSMMSCGWGDGEPNKNGIPVESESAPSEVPFCKDGQLTYREQSQSDPKLTYRIDETPQKMEAGMSDPLKKYIHMLLERPPGLPVDDSMNKSFESTLLSGSTLQQWQHILVAYGTDFDSGPLVRCPLILEESGSGYLTPLCCVGASKKPNLGRNKKEKRESGSCSASWKMLANNSATDAFSRTGLVNLRNFRKSLALWLR